MHWNISVLSYKRIVPLSTVSCLGIVLSKKIYETQLYGDPFCSTWNFFIFYFFINNFCNEQDFMYIVIFLVFELWHIGTYAKATEKRTWFIANLLFPLYYEYELIKHMYICKVTVYYYCASAYNFCGIMGQNSMMLMDRAAH